MAEELPRAAPPKSLAQFGARRGGGSRAPDLVVIDSIQTMYLDTLDSSPGTVSQVRGAAQELIALAKRRGFVVVLVGHVTKEGLIAGPRVLEHMVDTVLYFEGERGHQFRILRAVKNRFGATDEIGVFEMSDRGLVEVPNPSALFLADRDDPTNSEAGGRATGAAVFAGIEGTRPLLVEVQALVAPSLLGTPRRAVVGWDATRLAMLTAVLDARCGLSVGANDIYLNIAGGLRIVEPAADLAVAAALVSALTETPVPADTVVFGEIGLSGRVRPVAHAEARLKEAAKLGFAEAWVPAGRAARGGQGLATVLTGLVLRTVRASGLSPIDRTLGFIFGLARGAFLVCLAYLLLVVSVQPNDWPAWIRDAKSEPYLHEGADVLRGFLPESLKIKSATAAEELIRNIDPKAADAAEADKAIGALDITAPAAAPKPESAPASS